MVKPKGPHQRFQPLRRAVQLPVWADLALRIGAVIALISIVILIHWIGRDGLHDSYDGRASFLDIVYFTMISVTTTGFGDIVPVSNGARLVEAVIVTPIRLAVLYIFVGTAYNYLIKRSWERWRMARIQKHLTGHIVVLGFGISGSQAVTELIDRGTEPGRIVVMDPSAGRLAEAEAMGCNVMQGDASRDEALIAVRIGSASAILISAGRDDTSILIVLTARHLAPKVPISVVVRAEDNESLAKQAGADNVINPVRFTGHLLAGSAHGMHVADYLADLASVSGRVQLVERPAGPEDFGGSIDSLASGGKGLRLYRAGRAIGFWEPAAQKIERGDMIVEIRPTSEAEAEAGKA